MAGIDGLSPHNMIPGMDQSQLFCLHVAKIKKKISVFMLLGSKLNFQCPNGIGQSHVNSLSRGGKEL